MWSSKLFSQRAAEGESSTDENSRQLSDRTPADVAAESVAQTSEAESNAERSAELKLETVADLSIESNDVLEMNASSSFDAEFLTEKFDALQKLMETLLDDFKGKLKYDAKKQTMIDQLYQENLAFRDGLVEQCKKKLTLAVVEQIDDAEKQIAFFENATCSEENFRKIKSSFADVALCLRDMLLERFDVESWQSEPDSPFDPRRQRTLRTTPTGDRSKEKTIRRSLRFGYQTSDGLILRPEMVDAYVFKAELSLPVEPARSENAENAEKPEENAQKTENVLESERAEI